MKLRVFHGFKMEIKIVTLDFVKLGKILKLRRTTKVLKKYITSKLIGE